MKKHRLAGLALLAPLALTCACSSGTAALTIGANWHRQTDTTQVSVTFDETLTYSVTFDASDPDAEFGVHYENGTYTMRTTGGPYTAGGVTNNVYHLHTELTIDVYFTLGDERTDTMQDFVTTDVYFMGVANELRPISSTVETMSASPFYSLTTPASLEEGVAYTRYHYKTETVYDADFTQATFTQTNLAPEEGEEAVTSHTCKLSGSGTFLDNNQIYFALRGLDMSAAFGFRTIDMLTPTRTATVAGQSPTNASGTYTFAIGEGEAEERAIETCEITIGYNRNPPGQSQTITYARKTSPSDNTYRNVPLRIEAPKSHGTMVYRLTHAAFSE